MAKQAIVDRGVSKLSTMDAHVPSAFAKSALFYPIISGQFFCDRTYRIERDYLDMFLLMFVRRGQLGCEFENEAWRVGPDELIVMDCKQPHKYYSTHDHTQFQYFHFDGVGCQAYYQLLKSRDLLHTFKPAEATTVHINSILQLMRQPYFKEQTASILLHTILRNISDQSDGPDDQLNDAINWAVEFLYNHYPEQISVDDLAEQANLSKYHFIRLFKRGTSSTPHEFLINVRIKRAMELLSGSDESIESISINCGFNSPSHFARCFKNLMGATPGEFRKLHQLSMGGRWF